jgi:DNA-directed RNA polymerase specialized sigma24 family protein
MSTGSPGSRFRRTDWVLNQSSLGKLLALLDSDRSQAAEKYELLRRKLVKFFEWRGAPASEEHADEAINRISRRLEEGESVQNVFSYSYGVARLLLKEIEKHAIKERMASVALGVAREAEAAAEVVNLHRRCCDECLSALTAENRELILKYYEGERRQKIEERKALAESLHISADALRIRAHRIRARLEICMNDCLEHLQR